MHSLPWTAQLAAALLLLIGGRWKADFTEAAEVSSPGLPICFSKPDHYWSNATSPLKLSSRMHPLTAAPSVRGVCPRRHHTQFSKCPKKMIRTFRLVEIISNDCRLPRITPEQFAKAMQGRTLWLWGDSMMNEIYETVLQCSEKSDQPLPVNAGGTEQMNYKWAHIEMLSKFFGPSQRSGAKSSNCIFVKCVKLQSGADVCFMRNNMDSLAEKDGSMPCLDAVAPEDVVLVNAGTGIKMTESAKQEWRGRAMRAFLDWKTKRDRSGQATPTLIWREFFSQHFLGRGGHYVSRQHAKLGCLTKVNPEVMVRNNQRNAGLNEMMEAAGIPVFPVHRLSAPLNMLHPGQGDCTHWCQYAGDVLEDVWNMLQLYVIGLVAPQHLEGL